MAPQAPAAAATGVRDLRPGTRGAAACGEVGPGAGVRGELGGKPGGVVEGGEESVLGRAGAPRRRRWELFSPTLGTRAESHPDLFPGPG